MENHDDMLAAARRLEQYAAAHMTGPQLADVRMVVDAARRRGQVPHLAHRVVGLAVLDGGALKADALASTHNQTAKRRSAPA